MNLFKMLRARYLEQKKLKADIQVLEIKNRILQERNEQLLEDNFILTQKLNAMIILEEGLFYPADYIPERRGN